MKKNSNTEPEPIDRLIDVFLEEVLTGRKPPDLTSRILAAHRAQENAAGGNAVNDAKSMAGLAPRQDHGDMVALPAPTLVPATPIRSGVLPANGKMATIEQRSASSNSPRRRRNSSSSHDSRRSWFPAVLAVCAAGLVAVVGWYRGRGWEHWGNEGQTNAPVAVGNEDNAIPSGAGANAAAVVNSGEPKPPAKVEIELDDLPFGRSKNELAVDSSPIEVSRDSVEPLPSDRVVAEIDAKLAQLWSNLGVKPTPGQPAAERLKNTLAALSGRSLDEAALATMPGNGTAVTVEQLLRRDLQSGQFGRHWATLWMKEWLPASSLQTGPAAEFHKWLSAQINQQRPWNAIARELLAVELPKEKGSVSPPSAYFVSALAGDENRRLVETLGRSFLNTKMNCVRCHDARSLPEGSHGDQSDYWSLVALLKGIDADGDLNVGTRRGFDQQAELFAADASPLVYYDRPNGVLESAVRLPDEQLWNTGRAPSPRVALANWISQSDRFSEATVNEVWSFVFGRPLVPQTLNIENASHAERAELLRFLAQQFRANDYNMPQLVQWVVSSQAFAMQPVQMDRGRWLSLLPEELDAYQLSELVFAAGPTLGRDQAASLESSLELVVEWNKNLGRVETLAQPNLPTTLDATNNALPVEPATSYLLHATRPTQAQQTFVLRLLRAKLRWEEQVEHVVGLCDQNVDQQRVQHLARILLEQNNGDAKNALLHLLWCVQQMGAT